MLEGMRKASQGWVGRIFMGIVLGFISLSFVVWGIGDIFRNLGTNTVASVGQTDISAEALRSAYQTQLQNLQREARRAITNDQARAMGLDRQVLNRLISQALLDDQAKELKLGISDQEVARTILADPVFQGPSGQFDPMRFQELLRDNGYTEASFAREQRRGALRQAIIESMTGKMPIPGAVLDAVHRYRSETRAVQFFEIPASAAGEIAAPSEQDIQSLYEARRATFRAPEYRKFIYLAITPASLADPSKVSDADAQALYERMKGQRYGTPERRKIEQVIFPDEASASAALAKIKAGASLADVAKAANLEVVDAGNVSKAEIFDRALADAAFALAKGAVSEPVKSQFGFALMRAVEIEPEKVKAFAEVADDLKKELASERARSAARGLADKVEDERTSGKALADAAKPLNLSATTVESDAQGLDQQGKELSLPEREALLRAVFASDVGVDNDHLTTRDGSYIWFEVLTVDPSRERRLDEVKDQVVAAWKDDEINKRLSAKATDIVTALKAGQTMEAAAKGANAALKREDKVGRLQASSLPEGAVARVFGLPVGEIGSASGADQSRIIFKILSSEVPPNDAASDVMKSIGEQLRSAMAEDLVSQYLAALQLQLGVKINEPAVRAATGGGDANTF